MALDPNAPLFPVFWDDDFEARYQAALGGGVPDQQQFALPGEIAKHGDVSAPPPPPPPPQTIGPGVPVVDEVGMVSPQPELGLDVGPVTVQPSTPELNVGPAVVEPSLPEAQTPDLVPYGVPVEQAAQSPYNLNGLAPELGTPDEYQSDTELGEQYADRSVDEQNKFRIEHEEAQKNFGQARLLEESRLDLERQRAHGEAMLAAQHAAQQKRAKIDADATEVANTSPLDTISKGRQIAGIAAAIVGGFAMNKTGRNVGLEAVGQMIDEAAAEQATKLQNLQGQRRGVSEDLATAGDEFQTQETMRLGMWDHFIRNLETEVQSYDPRGTTALRTMDSINQARAMRQAALDKFEKDDFDRSMKVAEFGLKQGEFGLKYQEMLDKKAKAAAGAGAAHPPAYFAALNLPTPPFDMTDKDYDKWLARSKSAKDLNGNDAKSRKETAEATKAEAEAEAAQSGFVIANPESGEAFVNKDSKPFVVMDATERQKLRGITTAAVNIRRLADKIEEVRKKTGGGSTLIGSDDAQELTSLAKAVDFETYKAFDLGAPSAGDASMAEGIRGGVDLTSFLKDPKKGLQSYADSVEKKANTHLRGAGYTGPAIRFRRTGDLGAAKTDVVDELGGKLTSALFKAPINADNPLGANAQKIAGEIYKPLNDETNKWFEQMTAYAAVQNDMGDRARKYLREIADKAVYPDVKARAKAELDKLPGAHPRTER